MQHVFLGMTLNEHVSAVSGDPIFVGNVLVAEDRGLSAPQDGGVCPIPSIPMRAGHTSHTSVTSRA